MVTFANWLSSSDQVKRITLLNGYEPVLVEEAITTTIKTLGRLGEVVHLESSKFDDSELWELASQNTFFSHRILVIREAELIKNWAPIKCWLDACRQHSNYLMFVANWPQDGYGLELIKLLRQRTISTVIDCKITNDNDLVKWIKGKVKTDERTAFYLIARTGGDLLQISNLCNKLNALGSALSDNVIDALTIELAADSFVDSLIMLNKKNALLAIEEIRTEDYSKVIGQLTAGLIAVTKLNRALQVRTVSEKELAQSLGRGYYYAIRKYAPVAPRYDANKRVSRHRVLAVADDAVQRGIREGILESLIMMW